MAPSRGLLAGSPREASMCERNLPRELRTAVCPRVHEWSPERSLESVGVAGPSPVYKQASKQASEAMGGER